MGGKFRGKMTVHSIRYLLHTKSIAMLERWPAKKKYFGKLEFVTVNRFKREAG